MVCEDCVDSPIMTLLRLGLSTLVTLSFPLQCNPARRSALSILRYLHSNSCIPADRFLVYYVIITVVFSVGAFVIAYHIDNLGSVTAIVGATGSTMVSLILPGGFYYWIHHKQTDHWWQTRFALLQFVIGIMVVPLCLCVILIF